MIRGGHGGRRSRPPLDDSVQLHPEDNIFDTPITSRVPYNDLRNTLGHRHDSYGHGGRAHGGRYYGRRASRATNYPYNRHEGGSVRRIVSPKHKNSQGNTVKYDLKSCIEANQLDDLSPGDIEKLQRLLDRKKSREQQQRHQQQSMNMYSGMMDQGRRPIVPYVGRVPDVKKLLTENRFSRLADLVVPLDVLSGTDFVKHVHAQFENVSREEMDELVLARTVAINSAPSLFSILLMVEETCSYFAGLDRLDIPINPYDPYSSTLSALKHATFSKLNVAKLSCMMSEGERTPTASAYDFLKKIASGNGTTVKSFSRSVEPTVAPFPAATKPVVPEISDIREFDFEIFKHPFQVVICYLATIEKIVSEIKGHRAPGTVVGGSHINNKDRSRYIKDYDTQGILKRFKDGCIINLVKQGFCQHACNDNACKRRSRYALSVPHNLGMVFCPPTESSAVDDMDMYFEKNRHPMRTSSFDDSRSATSVDSSCSAGSHKPLTPTDVGCAPDFHVGNTSSLPTDSNNACGGGKFSERRASSSYKQHRRRTHKHISPLDRPSNGGHQYHQRHHHQNGDRRSSRGAGSSSSLDNNGTMGPRLSPSSAYPPCSSKSGGGNDRYHGHQNGDGAAVPHSPVTTPPPPEVFSPERQSSEERSDPRLHKSPLTRSTSANSGGSKRRSFADSPSRSDEDDESDSSSSSTTVVNKDRFKKRSGSRGTTPLSSPRKQPSATETVSRESPGRSGGAPPRGDNEGSENEDDSEKGVKSNPKESVIETERFESGEKSPTFIETDDESDDEDDQMSITSYDHSESSSSESGSDSDGEAGESDMTL
ncbi:mRNA transactivator/RNA splicing transport regulator [Elephant endotheliotropic herpesvirus 2]|nr:mRNA transactivator/RNA splicing transport regulator [Elephant endotheliotropic herpesvirus 2]